MTFKIEHNIQTGEVTEIALTDEELQEIETLHLNQKLIHQEKQRAKTDILNRIGLTEDEVRLLLS